MAASAKPIVAAATIPAKSFPILVNIDCLRSLETKPAQLIMDVGRTQPLTEVVRIVVEL
jgi:hypothetical protein